MNFGNILLKIRKEKNISQEQLAQKIGVTRQTVSNWELNITVPNIKDLKKIASVLDISYEEMLNTNNVRYKKNEKHEMSKNFMNAFKIIVFFSVVNIMILIAVFVVWKIKYNKLLPYQSYSIICNYGDSSYTYNVDYKKNNKIIKVTIDGSVKQDGKGIDWIEDLDRFIFSKKITDQTDLRGYIVNKYRDNGGKCS